MRRFALTAVLLLAVERVHAAPLSPAAIARDIAKHGAREVVSRLWSNGDYDRVMNRIDRGDAQWIALSPKLAPGTDAGTAEELPIALAFALPKNPRAVLSVLGPPDGLPIGDVCSAPFIDGTVKDVAAYVKRSERAVAGVLDPRLAKTRDACLAQLHKA